MPFCQKMQEQTSTYGLWDRRILFTSIVFFSMTGCVFVGDSWTVWVKGSGTTGAAGDVLISIGVGSVAVIVGSIDLD